MEQDLRAMFGNEAIESSKNLLLPFYSTHWNKSFSNSEELYIQQPKKAKEKLLILWTCYFNLAKLEAEGNEDALADFRYRLNDAENFENGFRALGWPEELVEAVIEGICRWVLESDGELLGGGGQFLDDLYAPIPRPDVDIKDVIVKKWGELTWAFFENSKEELDENLPA